MWFGVMKEGERKAFGGIASPRKHAENIGGIVFTTISACKNNVGSQKT